MLYFCLWRGREALPRVKGKYRRARGQRADNDICAYYPALSEQAKASAAP